MWERINRVGEQENGRARESLRARATELERKQVRQKECAKECERSTPEEERERARQQRSASAPNAEMDLELGVIMAHSIHRVIRTDGMS